MAKRFDYENSYKAHKRDVIADICGEIKETFGAHVPETFKDVNRFFQAEAKDYVVTCEERIGPGEYRLHEVTYSDFLFMNLFFNDTLSDLIGYRYDVELDQNDTGIFGWRKRYLDREKMRYLAEYVETLYILKNHSDSMFNFQCESLRIRPPRHSVQGKIYDLSLERVYYGYTEEKKGEIAIEIGIGWLYLPNFLDSIGCPIGDEKSKTPGEVLDYLLKNYVDRNRFSNICGSAGVTAFEDLKSAKDRFRREGFTGKFSYGATYIDRLDHALNLEPGNFFEVNPPENPAKEKENG